jgi:CheY-like chemotaxis protein
MEVLGHLRMGSLVLLMPHISTTDVVMPGMNGVELAIHFRKLRPGCKILLFSGQAATADLLVNAREAGHDFDLVLKPVHPTDLLAKLSNLTNGPFC